MPNLGARSDVAAIVYDCGGVAEVVIVDHSAVLFAIEGADAVYDGFTGVAVHLRVHRER